ncbi:hypothetical protein ABID97_002549 [Variovorax sp. OAS795]|uniref:hypothetical protein n=1 Tax=Variovorax sp. OAS795 TaxID=3034231 RepID=UPI00339B67BD
MKNFEQFGLRGYLQFVFDPQILCLCRAKGFHCAALRLGDRAGAFALPVHRTPVLRTRHFASNLDAHSLRRCANAPCPASKDASNARDFPRSESTPARCGEPPEGRFLRASCEWRCVSSHRTQAGLRTAPPWNRQAWMLRTAAFAKAIERSAGAAMIVFETH